MDASMHCLWLTGLQRMRPVWLQACLPAEVQAYPFSVALLAIVDNPGACLFS